MIEVLALLNAVPFRADPGTFVTVLEGPRASTLLGCESGQALGPDALWNAVVLEADRPRVTELLRAVAADGTARAIEHGVQVPGRPLAWFRTAVQLRPAGALDTSHRSEPMLVGVMLDITAARATERQSQEVESWLATVGESLPFDFWICDRLGRFVLQNPVSRRRLGNLVGCDVRSVTSHAEQGGRWEETISRALSGERVQEELKLTMDGVTRVYSRILSPVRQGEEISGALGVDIDVTELKQAENRLRQSLEELRLAQDELVRRERLSVLGEMAAAVAHEVRNPLASMFNAIELLRRSARPEPEAELLRILFEELSRLDDLVDDMFDLVRPLAPEMEPQAVAPVIEKALNDALRTIEHAERIRVIREVEEVSLSMDGQLVGLALVNVLRNALQAMPEGGVLGISACREERNQQEWAQIVIRDSGPGIAPEVKARIFEPFFTTRPMGSGLGLAIVKRVISEHHGEIEVQSARGEGTSFVLRFPARPPAPIRGR